MGSIIFSFNKFSTFNSFSSFIGVAKILFTNTEYDVIQNNPNKVIIAKPNTERKLANDFYQKLGTSVREEDIEIYIYEDSDVGFLAAHKANVPNKNIIDVNNVFIFNKFVDIDEFIARQ